MSTPAVNRSVNEIQNFGARYTPRIVRDIQTDSEKRIEHHNLCRKERLKEAFELPGTNDSKKIMFQVDNHFEREKNLQRILTDLGLQNAMQIHAIDTAYVPAVAADPAHGIAAVPAVLETYTTRDLFDLKNEFTQTEIEEHCRIMNLHEDVENPVGNLLALTVILSNCKKELHTKIEA